MRKKKDSYGFTLIEVIIATGIIALLFPILFTMYRGTIQSERKISAMTDNLFTAQAVFSIMERELDSEAHRAGIPEDRLEGIDGLRGIYDNDRLSFITLLSSRGEPSRVTYSLSFENGFFERTEETALKQRGEFDEEALHDVISPNIVGFNCRFFDGKKYIPSWSSEQGGFPLAIEITLTMKNGKKITRTLGLL